MSKLTPIEMEALLVRHSAAITELDSLDTQQRAELLYLVVCPTPEVLEASLTAAKQKGISTLALQVLGDSAAARHVCASFRRKRPGRGSRTSRYVWNEQPVT